MPVGPDAHNYETTRSTLDWHAAGVITAVDKENITFELRNETRCGDTITFILPHTMNGERVEKNGGRHGEFYFDIARMYNFAIRINIIRCF